MSKSASQRSINLDAEGEGSVQEKAVTPPASATASAAANLTTDPVSGTSADYPNPPENKKKTPSNRCQLCRKKVGLTGVECRCGGLYCHQHRYSDKHDCTFDYRQLGAEEIRKNNPVVVGEKIQKI